MKRILIIEDDPAVRAELSAVLRNNGYAIVLPDSFDSILDILESAPPHLVLLDIGLPGLDGYRLCAQIRSVSSLPVIFVTGRDTEMDELTGITLGGDDFIRKPYHIPILLARIAALLKRAYPSAENGAALFCKGVSLYPEEGKIEADHQTAELTKTENKILSYLFRHQGEIVSRNELTDFLWESKDYIDDNALSVNITRIRDKLEQIGAAGLIVTKHRRGYLV